MTDRGLNMKMEPLKPEVVDAIQKVLDKAPSDPMMRQLAEHLTHAAKAAAAKKLQNMQQSIQAAYNVSTAIGNKVDILVEFEDAIEKIRRSAE